MSLISNIEVNNFKSIKSLSINCDKTINLFVGTPNSGKSNLLEAMSTFMLQNQSLNIGLNSLVRLNEVVELFNYGNIKNKSEINLNKEKVSFSFHNDNSLIFTLFDGFNEFKKNLSISGKVSEKLSLNTQIADKIIRYDFEKKSRFDEKSTPDYLKIPSGTNLFWVIENNSNLKEYLFEIVKIFGLKFYNQQPKNSLLIFKELSDFDIFTFSFNLLPDTIQRLLFYHTAISTNLNNVLLFEEPEAHMFPPYISKFTNDVIDNNTNQYFITTHSPYVIDNFLNEAFDELAIHQLYFENGETKAYTLTKENLDTLYQNGSNAIFDNLERFIENGN